MFKFTPIEKKVVAAIEANYRQQMHDMMVRYFKVPYKGKIESTELEVWLNSIEVTRELCNVWLSNMVDSPTVEDHLNNGIFSVAAIGTSSILSFLFNRAVNFFPEYIKKFFHSRDAHGKHVAETVGETFSTALTPVVLRFLHDAFCRSYHGNRDEAETLFQEMVEKNEHFTKLIQQECSALSVELVKLFRFREMLLLGKKDKLALNFDVRKDFIKRAGIPSSRYSEINAVIEYYFIYRLNQIFNQGFQRLYVVHEKEITDERHSKILHWLSHFFESEEQRQVFTCQMQMEFMQITRDFLLSKMNEPGVFIRHPILYSVLGGLIVSLLVSSILLLSIGFSSMAIIAVVSMISFGLGMLAVNLSVNNLTFFQYKRGSEDRKQLQNMIDSIHSEYFRIQQNINELIRKQGNWVYRSERFLNMDKRFFFIFDSVMVARGSGSAWLREYAAQYRHSKAMAIDLINIYEKIITQGREQNKTLLEALEKQHYHKVDQWIKKTESYLQDPAQLDDIQDFELIEKFREQVLDLASQLSYVPVNLINFYKKPVTEGGLGGNERDFSRVRRFASRSYEHLRFCANILYKRKEPVYTSKPFFQGSPHYRQMLGLSRGIDYSGLNAQTIDEWLEQTNAYLLSLCMMIHPGRGLDPMFQPILFSDEFITFRMMLLRQFADLCIGSEAHPDKTVRLKIEYFVRRFFHAEPKVIFDDFINSSFMLNPDKLNSERIMEGNRVFIVDELEHLTEVLRLSMAYIGESFTPMQVLRYYMDKYPANEQHFIDNSNAQDLLNPQGSGNYIQTVVSYCRDTRRFLRKEKNNQALQANNIWSCYRFHVSIVAVKMVLLIARDMMIFQEDSSMPSEDEQRYLQRALVICLKFIKEECHLPEAGSELSNIMDGLQKIAHSQTLNMDVIRKYMDSGVVEAILKNPAEQLQIPQKYYGLFKEEVSVTKKDVTEKSHLGYAI